MKPVTTNSLSAWGYVGLLILFSLPYIGTPAMIICALFAPNPSAKSFARALIILELIAVLIIVALLVVGVTLGEANLEDIFEDLRFNFQGDEGSAFVNSARYYLEL